MDLKVVFVVVFLSALAITSTHAGIPKCCIKTKSLSPRVLLKAERWERQYSSGACDIDALKVYLKNRSKPFCVNPKLELHLIRHKNRQQYQARGVH